MEQLTTRRTKTARGLDRSLVAKLVTKVHSAYKSSAIYNDAARREQKREAAQSARVVKDNRFHLGKAINWTKRAQDATPDGGVSRGYSVGWVPHFDAKGWQASYPETTGYIIPTFFDCAVKLKDPDLKRRALAMADWEIDVQLSSGAVMGGVVNADPTPAVFNTGQVLLGWLRAFEETADDRYIVASEKAARFLLQAQSADGAWRKGVSRFVSGTAPTYNARTGWAMILHGLKVDNQQYVDAGRRNMEYVQSQQQPNGWCDNNCLSDASAPLTHTIAYTCEGLLGAYDLLGERTYLEAVKLTADHLVKEIRNDGSLPGRFDCSWRPAVSWNCLTGSAQLSGILRRLHVITGESEYLGSARKLLAFVKGTQNCVSEDGGLRGGVKGSFPFDGGYGRYELLNWAAKFYIDALLLEEKKPRPQARTQETGTGASDS